MGVNGWERGLPLVVAACLCIAAAIAWVQSKNSDGTRDRPSAAVAGFLVLLAIVMLGWIGATAALSFMIGLGLAAWAASTNLVLARSSGFWTYALLNFTVRFVPMMAGTAAIAFAFLG